MRSLIIAALMLPFSASAFCGFYVSGGGANLFNDASMVALVRDGTRTVLSMQNNYRGPAEDFALVIPVPVILTKESVRTLPREAFTRLDELTSPRLVEVPRSPCGMGFGGLGAVGTGAGGGGLALGGMPRDLGVKVEAKFDVEEYEIIILSAKFSLGLEIWLKENKYAVPAGAEKLLQPYVQNGSKFFVAKVNAKKVKFKDGHVVLSPLRFHYDSEKFELPVRLGLVNSGGSQDLIVHIIAKDRYELANAKNVLVPTNIDVRTRAQPQFGGFYSELLSRTFKKNPGAAVTEFAWQGALPPPQQMVGGGIYGVTCDPCPPPHPVDNPLARYLGVDVMPKIKTDEGIAAFAQAATVTRLHLRYTKESAPDDLVFTVAEPIHGGIPEAKVAGPAKHNRFQGRYVMWVDGCGSLGLGGGMFSAPSPLSGPSAPSAKLIDPFEQIIVNDIVELDTKAVPLAKNPPALPLVPLPAPLNMGSFSRSPSPTRVKFGELVVSAGLEKALVYRVLQRMQAQLRFCYERSLTKNPALAGRVVVQFTISPEGRVTSSNLMSTTLGDPETESCVTTRPKMWVFPTPDPAQNVTVTVPMVFTAQ